MDGWAWIRGQPYIAAGIEMLASRRARTRLPAAGPPRRETFDALRTVAAERGEALRSLRARVAYVTGMIERLSVLHGAKADERSRTMSDRPLLTWT